VAKLPKKDKMQGAVQDSGYKVASSRIEGAGYRVQGTEYKFVAEYSCRLQNKAIGTLAN
jgi:hypothetical protein